MDRYDSSVVDTRGNTVSGVTVTVYEHGTTTLATLFQDDAGTGLGNPFNADDQPGENGEFFFYARNGRYDIVLGGTVSETRPDQILFEPAAEGVAFVYESETSAPPSAGAIRFNNADLSLATQCYVSEENYGGSDVASLLAQWYSALRTRKDVLIVKDPAFLSQASFDITGYTDNGAYVTFTLSNHSGKTSFTDEERVALWPLLAGPDGSMTGPGSSTDNAIARFNGTSGAVIQNSPNGPFVGDDGRLLTDPAGASPAVIGGLLTTATFSPPNDDLNDVAAIGWHSSTSGTTANRPTGGGFWHIFTGGRLAEKFQLAIHTLTNDLIYYRRFSSGAWGPWIKIPTVNGFQMTGALDFRAEQSVASASTVDLGAVAGNFVQITGTTTITSFGTASAGTFRKVRFASSLTLTHNGTSLILPTGANITTAANDFLEAYSLGSGNWIVTNYQRADGSALVPPAASGFDEASGTVSNLAVTGLATTARRIRGFFHVFPSSVDDIVLTVTVGGTRQTGASAYTYSHHVHQDSDAGTVSGNIGTTSYPLASGPTGFEVDNAAAHGVAGWFTVENIQGSSEKVITSMSSWIRDAADEARTEYGGGVARVTSAVDGIDIRPGAGGNLQSGSYVDVFADPIPS